MNQLRFSASKSVYYRKIHNNINIIIMYYIFYKQNGYLPTIVLITKRDINPKFLWNKMNNVAPANDR